MYGTQKKIIIRLLFWKTLLNVCSAEIVKRSPLELGFVTFPEVEKSRFVLFNMTKVEEVKSPEKEFHGLSTKSPIITHSTEWIQGYIKNHAFIPAHIHHIFIPFVISVKHHASYNEHIYPEIIGGYGIGQQSGGQGAGHGFQILFN
ncbi:unnamed protein product [Diabrotica balteata]|uniref:Secreted protein n=1 Tax=Diabrotica balteata TaxID=107213 RepID=A0A9N9T0B7_DIABA|nr:unnamed protein product [Diabrotica balteata]